MVCNLRWSEGLIILACAATVPLALIAPKGVQSSNVLVMLPVAILLAASARAAHLRRWGQHGAALIFPFLLVSAAGYMMPLPGAEGAMYEYHVSPSVLIVVVLAALAPFAGAGDFRHDRVVISLTISGLVVLGAASLAYVLLSRFYALEPQVFRQLAQNTLFMASGVFLFKLMTRNDASMSVLVAVCASGTVVLWCLNAGIDP